VVLIFLVDKMSNKIDTIYKNVNYKLVLGFQGQTKNTCSILNFFKKSKSLDPSVHKHPSENMFILERLK
jgi:hypothetical protein